jgi:hypothetical protein
MLLVGTRAYPHSNTYTARPRVVTGCRVRGGRPAHVNTLRKLLEAASANERVKLVQPDGKSRFSSTVKGKDGGFDMKTGLGVAKFAGSMYMNMMNRQDDDEHLQHVDGRESAGGMGMLGNPALMNKCAYRCASRRIRRLWLRR